MPTFVIFVKELVLPITYMIKVITMFILVINATFLFLQQCFITAMHILQSLQVFISMAPKVLKNAANLSQSSFIALYLI